MKKRVKELFLMLLAVALVFAGVLSIGAKVEATESTEESADSNVCSNLNIKDPNYYTHLRVSEINGSGVYFSGYFYSSSDDGTYLITKSGPNKLYFEDYWGVSEHKKNTWYHKVGWETWEMCDKQGEGSHPTTPAPTGSVLAGGQIGIIIAVLVVAIAAVVVLLLVKRKQNKA